MWASAWLGPYSTPAAELKPFPRVYDARKKYSGVKSNMPRLPAEEIRVGDIVLIEMSVTRWPVVDPPKSTQEAKEREDMRKAKLRAPWTKWKVDLRLEAVSLVFQGSQYVTLSGVADENVSF